MHTECNKKLPWVQILLASIIASARIILLPTVFQNLKSDPLAMLMSVAV